ncbi:unannotated protein [freshwater metagenome]|uniref:Unannotated protein n=1 Tax=freshwater metagenome TaxID=449393 RepID=A0A6J6D5C4_9ZZZZ
MNYRSSVEQLTAVTFDPAKDCRAVTSHAKSKLLYSLLEVLNEPRLEQQVLGRVATYCQFWEQRNVCACCFGTVVGLTERSHVSRQISNPKVELAHGHAQRARPSHGRGSERSKSRADRIRDQPRNHIRVDVGIRATILDVALAVLGDLPWNTNRCATVRNTVTELREVGSFV